MFNSRTLRSVLIVAIAAMLAVGCQRASEKEEGAVTMKFVRIPEGEFIMGSPAGESGRRDDEEPQHHVRITEPFYMSATEVTQQQYFQVMGYNPSVFKGADNPVEMVSWGGATEFCRRLSEKTGREVTLPTEAQWEYACRAGTDTRFSFGDDEQSFGMYCWYQENSNQANHPVATKKPNAWGLYDMHGNVQEWCSDRFDGRYWGRLTLDPEGPSIPRVVRGGSHAYPAVLCRSASRSGSLSNSRSGVIGFRVVFPGEAGKGKKVVNIVLAKAAQKNAIPQEKAYNFQSPAGSFVAGEVRDDGGVLVDDVEIEILPYVNCSFRLYDEGQFEVSWRPRRTSGRQIDYYLLARHTQWNLVSLVGIERKTRVLNVTLEQGLILAGQVVNADKRGIEQAQVITILRGSDWNSSYSGLFLRGDTEGRFEVRALPLGCDYRLIARAKGYGRERIEVDASKAFDNRLDVEPIMLATADLTVEGIVVDSNDEPVHLALVHCSGEGQEGDSTLTSTDGTFVLEGICRGKVRISASVGGHDRTNMSGSIETEAGATNIKVVMTKSNVPLPKGRTCFLAETGVWVDGAVVPISKVVLGQILGKTGCSIPAAPFGQIEKVEEHKGSFECRDIVFENGNRIGVVGAHCFLLDSGKWISAQDLRSGLRLKTFDGTVGIKSVTIWATPYVGKVYNLKIKDSDQYMVGKDGIIVRDY